MNLTRRSLLRGLLSSALTPVLPKISLPEPEPELNYVMGINLASGRGGSIAFFGRQIGKTKIQSLYIEYMTKSGRWREYHERTGHTATFIRTGEEGGGLRTQNVASILSRCAGPPPYTSGLRYMGRGSQVSVTTERLRSNWHDQAARGTSKEDKRSRRESMRDRGREGWGRIHAICNDELRADADRTLGEKISYFYRNDEETRREVADSGPSQDSGD